MSCIGAECLPYATLSDGTMGWTLTTRDRSGRTQSVQHFSGSGRPAPWGSNTTSTGTQTLSYGADATGGNVTAVDEAGMSHTSWADGLGRLKQVAENGLGKNTTYTWDALDNLTGVTHPTDATQTVAQTRTFSYSSMGRLMSATNPESGTVSYTYDANGHLIYRLAGNVQTAYSYDALNQLYYKTYNTGPTPWVSYTYNYGWRIAVAASNSVSSTTTQYVYDGLGRVNSSTQNTNGTPYSFTYSWNLADGLTSEQYPSGRTVNYAWGTSGNTAGRISGVSGSLKGVTTNYTNPGSIGYAAHGALSFWTGGDQVSRAYIYNPRLETSLAIAVDQYNNQLLTLGLGYASGSDNGNVQAEAIGRPGFSAVRFFGYDGANRLTSASEGGNWSQNYVYDVAGNQALYSGSSVIASSLTPQTGSLTTVPFNGSNQWNGATHDPSTGNMTGIPLAGQTFGYDAEQRLTQQTTGGTTTTFAYDGDGRRTMKTSYNGTTIYVYDAMGNLAAEYGGATPVCQGHCT